MNASDQWHKELMEHMREDSDRFARIETQLGGIGTTLASYKGFFAGIVTICSALAATAGLVVGLSTFFH